MLDNVLYVMDHMQTKSEQASGVIWKTNRLYIYIYMWTSTVLEQQSSVNSDAIDPGVVALRWIIAHKCRSRCV